ncbi:MAG: enoyl-CoA hydratase-related protein [Syntrophorhabdaceae bacterium]|nr:enoyl-CoA hydratase-related protein [Syntrophorhabdaceae bacterium]
MIDFQKEGHIAIFTINRPEKKNALNVHCMKLLTEALINFRDDDELWVGIITGKGDVFSAGMDIDDFLPMIRNTPHKKWIRPTAIMRGMELFKPIIAACNGLTYGGGFEIALACDIIVASSNAIFALPEVRVGICPGGGGTVRLPRMIPYKWAAQILFTGKPITAEEAYRIGLINKIVPPDKLMDEAKKMAHEICEASPIAVRCAKELMIRGMGMSFEEALRMEDDIQTYILNTEDCKEGFQAFFEKRRPRWKGK